MTTILDFNKLDNLSNQNDEVKLALEAIGRAVNIQAFEWLLARLNEVFNDFRLNLDSSFRILICA